MTRSFRNFRLFVASLALIALCTACSPVESHRTLEAASLASIVSPNFAPVRVAIGSFVNRSTYMNGLFADSQDRLGQQSIQILATHLSESKAFTVVDRRSMAELQQESKYSGTKQHITGAAALISGAVTEFGRRETGTKTLGGLVQRSKTQTLYAKVSLSVVDVKTSEVKATFQGAGEYDLRNNEILGTGGTAGYDSTLADKVLNLAIMEAIQHMVEGKNARQW